jgi:hypothetical protein
MQGIFKGYLVMFKPTYGIFKLPKVYLKLIV